MPLSVPSDIAVDLRQPVVGDSFGWEGLEPAAAKKSIVIHATASQSVVEDGFVIADYHVNKRGWMGVGVHFSITKDTYPGKPNFSAGGVQVHYIGDLLTWRAGTTNQNNGRIHIEISGLFTPGNGVPSENQLRAARRLVDYLIGPNSGLPSLNYYSQVTYHNAVPGQNTQCPGWENPQFSEWFTYLQGGAEPSWFAKAPAPVEPGKGSGTPEYEATFRNVLEQRTVAREGAQGIDVTTGNVSVPNIPVGKVIDVGGYFTVGLTTYARTVYSVTNNKWNGLDVKYFEPAGQLSGPVEVTVTDTPHVAPDPIVIPDTVADNVTDEQLQAAVVPESPKLSVSRLFLEWLAKIIANLIKRKTQ